MRALGHGWLPGLTQLRAYRSQWLGSDLVAGLSVAAVGVPIAIAYAQIAGFPPEVGIYSAIFPPIAYALFGTSRHLIVNPDSATCAIIAATLAPLAMPRTDRYGELSVVLALAVGVLCVMGGLLRLGIVANFLARPILTGYMNGIALSILVGQLGPLFGFTLGSDGFFRRVFEVVSRVGDAHIPTLVLGAGLFVALRVLKHAAPRAPAPLIVAIVGIVVAIALDLDERGVALVGAVPAGFAAPRLPSASLSDLPHLVWGACAITLVSYCSMMPSARGFAAKHGYAVNANQEFAALGAANIAAGLGQGFVVSGADSRTAVGDAAGAKTQVTGLVAAAAMAAVLLFFTGPLGYLPMTALAAIVISAVIGLFDVASLRRYFRVSRSEFFISLVTTLGVVTLGLLPGILIALGLAMLKLVALVSFPHDAVLGIVDTETGAHATEDPEGRQVPGLIIYRFDAALLFFNADHFKERVRAVVAASEPKPEWFLFDAESVLILDFTGAEALEAVQAELGRQGIVLTIARAKGLFKVGLERTGLAETIGAGRLFSTVRAAVRAFHERGRIGQPSDGEREHQGPIAREGGEDYTAPT